MGLYDRDYYRESRSGGGFGGGFGGGGGFAAGLFRLLNASFPIGTYLGIRVRVHITFPLVLGIYMLTSDHPLIMLGSLLLLFGSVLLHEFGHCLACRHVGGTANDILMWPLGGLAYCAPPRRPWPEFVTVIWGPLVNVILCLISWAGLAALTRTPVPVGFNPFDFGWLFQVSATTGLTGSILAELYVVNYILLLFNLAMIFYPFDGGRIVQILLWWRMGYPKSMRLATNFGMAGAVAVGILGFVNGNTLLVLIAIFGFFACYQQSQVLQHMGPMEAFEPNYAASARPQGPSRRERRRAAAQQKRMQREAREQQAMNEEVDRILAKISREGMGALSAREKKILQRASETKRG